ncbi:MAG: 50S ribosomal protein L3 N(5)-glutamine methyltransferase [Gammaproteobacteria bacterium]|nr:50S ribosomal protein L3 N(5)-glutamine methyltransferase [Gammaproteobacteria bacterium]
MSYSTEGKSLMTILDMIRFGISQARATELYYGHGTDNAVDDIFALVLETLHLPWDIDRELLQGRLTDEEKTRLLSRLEQRVIQQVPVPYITQTAHFCGMRFYVDERALIPRSPIAELIQQQFSPWANPDNVTRILDLCTGSGCIAIACCAAFPEAMVDAVDISDAALEVAAINRERHHMQDQLQLIQSDGFTQVPEVLYDIIVSNPPYVAQEDMQVLPAEYRHEPILALEADDNGLALVKQILQQAGQYLRETGILVIEVGLSEDALRNLYPEVPFVWLEFEHGGEGIFLLTAQSLREHFGV